MFQIKENLNSPVGRRKFIQRMAAAGLGTVAMTMFGCGSDQAPVNGTQFQNASSGQTTYFDPTNFPGIPGKSENAVVLNFALTLEILEADIYRQALNLASGLALDTALSDSPQDYSLQISDGGLGAAAATGFLYLQEFAYVEAAHRDFLEGFISTFDSPVQANPDGYQANFGTDLQSILTAIRGLEEEGVRAYLGAAGFLTDFNLVQTAATIYSTEARHSAALNLILGLDAGPTFMTGDLLVTPNYPSPNTFEYYRTPAQVLQDAAPYFKS